MLRKYALGLFVVMLAACSEDATDPLVDARLEIVSGTAQIGGVGADLAQPIVVKVTDGSGAPLANVPVSWNVIEGGGSVDSAVSRTNGQGTATVRWQLGGDPGAQTLVASTATASAAIRATAIQRFASVSAGFLHTCALTSSGQAYCWGNNSRGQAGSAALGSAVAPLAVSGRQHFVGITAGWFHTCGVTTSGEVYCWGENSVGQLGSPGDQSASPRRVALSESIAVVSAGYQHTCAVAVSGAVYCWGNDDFGQLGSAGVTTSCASPAAKRCSATPVRVAGNVFFKDISVGEFHTCAIAFDATQYCWGWNSNGQTGTNSAGDAILNVPTRVISNRFYRRTGVGARHSCAVTVDNIAECWGRNGAGENGLPPFTSLTSPAPLPTALRFSKVSGGDTNTCALGTDKIAYCWGSELGNGSGNATSNPTAVTLNGSVDDVDAGWQHACAVLNANGDVWCWGSNSNGQLGVAGTQRSNIPVKVQMAIP